MSNRLAPLAMLVVTLTATLAGCSQSNSAAPGDDEPAKEGLPARQLPWELKGCRIGVAIISVPAAQVALHLPPGFRSLSLGEIAMAGTPNPNNDGNFGMELFSCESGTGLNQTPIPGMSYASYFSAVEPPGALAQDVTTHFVKWDVMVPDQERRDLLLSYGIAAGAGSVSFSQEQDQGNMALHSGAINWDGRGADGLSGSAATEYADGSFVEFTQTPGGLATWRMNYTWIAGGVGPQVVVPAAGSFASSILGTQPRTGVGFSGRADFTGGSISLPAQPVDAPIMPVPPSKPRGDLF